MIKRLKRKLNRRLKKRTELKKKKQKKSCGTRTFSSKTK